MNDPHQINRLIATAKHKGDGTPHAPLDQQGRETIEEELAAYHELFISSLAGDRHMTNEAVELGFGEGKMYVASEALRRNMIDAVGTLSEIVADLGTNDPAAIQTTSTISRKATAMTKPIIPQAN